MNDCAFKDDNLTKGCYHHQDDLDNYQPPILYNEVDVKKSKNREFRHYRVGCHHCLHMTDWWPSEAAAVAHWNRINPRQMKIQEYRNLPQSAKI